MKVFIQSPQHRVYAHHLIAKESLDIIRRNKDRPFFLFCAWPLPHGPYRTDQVPDLKAYKDTGWTDAQKVYAAMVERLDSDAEIPKADPRVWKKYQEDNKKLDALLRGNVL